MSFSMKKVNIGHRRNVTTSVHRGNQGCLPQLLALFQVGIVPRSNHDALHESGSLQSIGVMAFVPAPLSPPNFSKEEITSDSQRGNIQLLFRAGFFFERRLLPRHDKPPGRFSFSSFFAASNWVSLSKKFLMLGVFGS